MATYVANDSYEDKNEENKVTHAPAHILTLDESRHLHDIRYLCSRSHVFARTSPSQKTFIVDAFRVMGYGTMMCGDGTNDMGALKHADVGVALLATTMPKSMRNKLIPASLSKSGGKDKEKGGKSGRLSDVTKPSPSKSVARVASSRKKDNFGAETVPTFKFGDASIASSFTSKFSSVYCTANIIKQGRCTLVTTIQLYKILALNSLVTAYSLSVLFLDGVKLGETQLTCAGLWVAITFAFLSRARPVPRLSPHRPYSSVFDFPIVISILVQFTIHMASLVSVVLEAQKFTPSEDIVKDPEADFKPSILNSAVFIMSLGMQAATFTANYRGKPFMESIVENRGFLVCILLAICTTLSTCTNYSPDLNSSLELVPLPEPLSSFLLHVVVADFLGVMIFETALNWVYASPKLKSM
eukprot:TRINITY_DN19359_c0_g1::TRINITY_DN19359_c0_g1_i1::g.7782::m.7782 TRINITY_DN19359_c0_g1::TRINITY_DN19359_c0_g1_i1::g.7782  ORF type:complete len:442 (+),score=58.61,sp/Q9EPE9/AT131_MOUSE/41.12/5e-84,Hydrolase/PF00702.21/2.7e-05,HAD/PF12710.2/0.00037,Hydrolase_3/PF08282.7/1.5e+03,Hydrolase_3/PF08282.7/0.089 TRINITY_DN19359_c0_g1_i1:90-1328(+)